jgi:hypothetical protein
VNIYNLLAIVHIGNCRAEGTSAGIRRLLIELEKKRGRQPLHLKAVIIGSKKVGKSCLLDRLTELGIEGSRSSRGLSFKNDPISRFWRSQISFEIVESPISPTDDVALKDANCVVYAFAVDDRSSFISLTVAMTQKLPVLILALKTDVRVSNSDKDLISSAEGVRQAKATNAHAYVEVSANRKTNLVFVYEEVRNLCLLHHYLGPQPVKDDLCRLQ